MQLYEVTKRRVALQARIRLADGNAEGTWNQIAYEGQWQGHSAGRFEFTSETFEQIIANFGRREDDVPVTYGHPDGATGAAEGAAGWISALKIDTDEKGRTALFAFVKWTKRAAEKISADELRYCSVVVGFESIDEVSGQPVGPELYEVGAVLSAFLDGMQKLAASREHVAASSGGGMAMDAAQIRSKLAELAQVLNLDLAELGDEDAYMKVWDSVNALLQASKLAELLGESAEEAAPAAAASRGVRDLVNAIGCMVNIEGLKTALDQLTDDATPEQVKQVIDGALMQQAAAGDDAPADPPPADETAAAADPADPVAAAEPEPSANPAEEPAPEGVTLPVALAEAIAAQLGLAVEELATLTPEEFDSHIGTLMSEPDAQPSAMLSRALMGAIESQLKTEKAEVAKLEKQIAKTTAENDALDVSLAIAEGKLVEGQPYSRDKLIELRAASRGLYDELVSGGPSVPTGSQYGTGAPEERQHAPTSQEEALAICKKEILEKDPELAKQSKKLRHDTYELAKKRYPEAISARR